MDTLTFNMSYPPKVGSTLYRVDIDDIRYIILYKVIKVVDNEVTVKQIDRRRRIAD